MRRLASAIVVGLLFAAALALSLPGVKAVRADPPGPREAPMCRPAQPPMDPAAIDRLTGVLRARAADHPEARVLNTRGYNYQTPPARVDPSIAVREFRLQR
jgi:hypothetical protein